MIQISNGSMHNALAKKVFNFMCEQIAPDTLGPEHIAQMIGAVRTVDKSLCEFIEAQGGTVYEPKSKGPE